ncbi:MAG: hypothetical protein DRO11_10690 [Methanobacteriota archaeon]|nr:MAG: hypothetical protein DRO11_10690 [Euryarchaeota archaeon]
MPDQKTTQTRLIEEMQKKLDNLKTTIDRLEKDLKSEKNARKLVWDTIERQNKQIDEVIKKYSAGDHRTSNPGQTATTQTVEIKPPATTEPWKTGLPTKKTIKVEYVGGDTIREEIKGKKIDYKEDLEGFLREIHRLDMEERKAPSSEEEKQIAEKIKEEISKLWLEHTLPFDESRVVLTSIKNWRDGQINKESLRNILAVELLSWARKNYPENFSFAAKTAASTIIQLEESIERNERAVEWRLKQYDSLLYLTERETALTINLLREQNYRRKYRDAKHDYELGYLKPADYRNFLKGMIRDLDLEIEYYTLSREFEKHLQEYEEIHKTPLGRRALEEFAERVGGYPTPENLRRKQKHRSFITTMEELESHNAMLRRLIGLLKSIKSVIRVLKTDLMVSIAIDETQKKILQYLQVNGGKTNGLGMLTGLDEEQLSSYLQNMIRNGLITKDYKLTPLGNMIADSEKRKQRIQHMAGGA